MVITCPSCSARYRLGEDRMRARGAKVTCPRCSHVFVVLRDEPLAAAGPPSLPSSSALDQPADRSWSGSPTASGQVRVVTPGPRKQRREVATVQTGQMPALKPRQEPEPEPEVAPATAADLDFAEVGIRTFRVKVAIGLTYDFGDLATLRRYMDQGRVGEDDDLCIDGETWTRLGSIEDLDAHFVAAWQALRAAGKAPVRRAEPPADDTASSARIPAVDSSSAFDRPVQHRDRRARTSGSRRSAPPPDTRQTRSWLAVGLITALLAGGWYLAWTHTRPQPQPPVQPPIQQAETEDEVEERRQRIERELKDEFDRIVELQDEPEETPAPRLEVVIPREGRRIARTEPQPEPTPDPREAGQHWFETGQRAMAQDNYGLAGRMFSKAVQKNPEVSAYWEAWGEAQLRLGDREAAAQSFLRAEHLGEAKVGR
jgi:predicted Zn finger-like uncharacterized protein